MNEWGRAREKEKKKGVIWTFDRVHYPRINKAETGSPNYDFYTLYTNTIASRPKTT